MINNRDFVQAALALHLITERQMNELEELIRSLRDKCDIPAIMIERGLLTPQQAVAIREILDQAVSFAGYTAKIDGDIPTDSLAAFEPLDTLFEPDAATTMVESATTCSTVKMNETDLSYAHYTIVGTIGAGGLGRVLRGMDRSLQREVAIKEIIDDKLTQKDKRLLARFLNEARITGQLQHPGIVPVYQIGAKSNGGLFYVMKYVRGDTLDDAIKAANAQADPGQTMKKRLALLDVLIDVCEAMGYAHAKGVIHRDLKPGNIIIGKHGENVLLDWGLAKYITEKSDVSSIKLDDEILDPEATQLIKASGSNTHALTMDGEILGTPSYMAPEQIDTDFGPVDRQSDVYALGVILFQILTGRLPYQGVTTVKQLLRSVIADTPSPDPRSVTTDCPPELAMICAKAMTKQKAGRFVDAAAMADQLRAYREGRIVSIYSYSRAELLKRFIRHHKPLLVGATIALCAVIAGSIFSVHFGINAHANAIAARDAVERLPDLENKSLQFVTQLAGDFQDRVQQISDELQTVADKIVRDNLRTNEQIVPELKKLYAEHPRANGFYYVSCPDGEIISAWPKNVQGSIGQNASEQEHFKQVLAAQKPVLSHLFKTMEGYDAIIFDVPVMDNGKMIGIVNFLLKPEVLIEQAFDKAEWVHNMNSYRPFVFESKTHRMLYDRNDHHLHGLNLMSGEFANWTTFTAFLEKTATSDFGIGKYSLKADILDESANAALVHRLAAWQTFKFAEVEWKLVVACLFQEGKGVLGQDDKTSATK